MSKSTFIVTMAAMLLSPVAAAADDLTGADSFLCAASQVTVCSVDGTCASEPSRGPAVPG